MSELSMESRLELMQLQLRLTQQQNQTAILLAKAKLKLQEKRRIRRQKKEEEEGGQYKVIRKERKRRSIWVRQWLARRPDLGQYVRLLRELKKEDSKGFRNFLRVDFDLYKEILQRIEGRIKKLDTNYRKALSPGLKLAITLRYLASGDSYHSLMYGFRVAHNTISLLIPQVCEAIIAEYAAEYVPCPTTKEEWLAISKNFSERWNFHHCLGALDGKHIAMKCPKNGGSLYYNYKGFHSIILMALVDADYKFLWVEVGNQGSAGDAQVFNGGELKEAIEAGAINFPPADALPNDDQPMPYFIVADDAFALRSWLQKPYSQRQMNDMQRIYNYRLSRARRIVENGFGILAHRFRCLLTTLQQDPNTVSAIVMACVCLHNLLRDRKPKEVRQEADQEDAEHNIVPGIWREDTPLVDGTSDFANHTTSKAAKKQREYLTHYYSSEAGSVPWQNDMI
jgi:hypothetical protein